LYQTTPNDKKRTSIRIIDKKPLLKDKLQEEQTKLLLLYMEVHEGLVAQVVKQISFLIFKFFFSISMKT